MSDPYLLLTPLLVLAVVALTRFIGCCLVYGIDATSGYNRLGDAGECYVPVNFRY